MELLIKITSFLTLRDNGIDRIKQKLGMFGICVPAIGQSGGLALLWRKELIVTIQNYSKYHIDASIDFDDGQPLWRLTGFYGEPDHNKRKGTWALLQKLAQQSVRPWVVLGDFNEVTAQIDKKGRQSIPPWRIRNICRTLDFCELHEIDFSGYRYMWSNKQPCPGHIELKLDRVYCNNQWRALFSSAHVHHLFTRNSDHMPILLKLKVSQGRRYKQKRGRFRFESMWLKNPECTTIVEANWGSGNDFLSNAEQCRSGLQNWARTSFGSVKKRVGELQEQLKDFQKQPFTPDTTKNAPYCGAFFCHKLSEIRRV